jgi:hypothetical protein
MAKVFVGLPIFNFINSNIKDNQDSFLKNSQHDIYFEKVVGASVEHARSMLIDRFLKTDCEYFLNLDADIIFLNEDSFDPIDRLISLDKDIVGGIYVYKKKPCLPVLRPLDLQKLYEEKQEFPKDYKFEIPKEPVEVQWMGNGFKLVKRKVIEDVKKLIKVPNLPMLYMGEYVSEDWAFDQRARELGYSVWADPTIKLGHVGTYAYTLGDYK